MRFSTDLTPEIQAEDYGEKLWEKDPDVCCNLRKVKPLIKALKNYDISFDENEKFLRYMNNKFSNSRSNNPIKFNKKDLKFIINDVLKT